MILAAVVVVFASGTWFGSPPPVAGQQARELESRPGFDGLGKAGRWLPIAVTVSNDGPPISGEVRLVTRTTTTGPSVVYVEPIDLAARSKKRIRMSAPASRTGAELRLDLVASGELAASVAVPVRLIGQNDFLVGLLSEDDAPIPGLGSLRRGGAQVSVARLRPDDIPTDPVELQALDALLIRNAAADRLGPSQRAALRAWLEAGGQLIVAGGPGWRRTIDGLDDLLPIEGLWSRQVRHLRAFGKYAAGAPPDGEALITIGSPVQTARVLLAQDSIPLIVERWVGSGRVTFIAADPSLEPFRSWPGSEGVWQRVLVGGRPPLLTPYDWASGQHEAALRRALTGQLDLGLPSPIWLGVFLIVYVAIAGPLQYRVLKRMDRREWAWVGFPVLAVGFTAVAYAGGLFLRGTDIRLVSLSVIRSTSGSETAPIDTYFGVVSPTRRSLDLELVDHSRPRVVLGVGGLVTDRVVVTPGPPVIMPGLRLEGRALQAMHSAAFGPASSPAFAQLRTTTGRIEGVVTNVGPDTLEHAYLVAGNEALAIGHIPPGEGRAVSVALATSQNGNSVPVVPTSPGAPPDDEQLSFLRSLLAARGGRAESPGNAHLVAWVRTTRPRITASGTPVDGPPAIRLVQQSLSVDFGDSAVTAPPGVLARTLLDGAAIERGGNQTFALRGPAVFQFDLPSDLTLSRVDRLSIHLSAVAIGGTSRGGADIARASIFRWPDRTWVDVPAATGGVGAVTFGTQFIDGDAIRVRIEPAVPEVGIQQLDVSLDGAR